MFPIDKEEGEEKDEVLAGNFEEVIKNLIPRFTTWLGEW